MVRALDDIRMPVVYWPTYREYGLQLTGSEAMQAIAFCPWCAEPLPTSVRDEFFDRLEALGLETDDPDLPLEFRSDVWWIERGL